MALHFFTVRHSWHALGHGCQQVDSLRLLVQARTIRKIPKLLSISTIPESEGYRSAPSPPRGEGWVYQILMIP